MPLASIFRQEALDHQSTREPIDRVAQVTVPYDWLVLILIGAVCFFVMLWAVLVKIELTLPVDVVAIKPTDDRSVVSPVSARVSEVLVDVGTTVGPGDALVRVVMPDLQRRLTESAERERIIREEMELANGNDVELSRMLIESRVESAALSVAIEQDDVISSPFAGEVVELDVSTGQMVTLGQEVVRIRVRESEDTFAVAFVSQSRMDTQPSNTEALIHCAGPQGLETFQARAISQLPQHIDVSNLAKDANPATGEFQLPMVFSQSAAIANGTLCTGHILLDGQTPLQILLGGSRGSDYSG